MQVHQDQFNFVFRTGAPVTQTKPPHVFPASFQEAFVVLRGFRVGFEPGEDHHFGEISTDLSSTWDAASRSVTVSCTLGLRDNSSDYDDKYGGSVLYTVITLP